MVCLTVGLASSEIMKSHGRMARGGHELPKVSLGPAMPYISTPCRRPPLKRSYGCFSVATR
jgi:hypothetical protein